MVKRRLTRTIGKSMTKLSKGTGQDLNSPSIYSLPTVIQNANVSIPISFALVRQALTLFPIRGMTKWLGSVHQYRRSSELLDD
jgi:hypothetical protein